MQGLSVQQRLCHYRRIAGACRRMIAASGSRLHREDVDRHAPAEAARCEHDLNAPAHTRLGQGIHEVNTACYASHVSVYARCPPRPDDSRAGMASECNASALGNSTPDRSASSGPCHAHVCEILIQAASNPARADARDSLAFFERLQPLWSQRVGLDGSVSGSGSGRDCALFDFTSACQGAAQHDRDPGNRPP